METFSENRAKKWRKKVKISGKVLAGKKKSREKGGKKGGQKGPKKGPKKAQNIEISVCEGGFGRYGDKSDQKVEKVGFRGAPKSAKRGSGKVTKKGKSSRKKGSKSDDFGSFLDNFWWFLIYRKTRVFGKRRFLPAFYDDNFENCQIYDDLWRFLGGGKKVEKVTILDRFWYHFFAKKVEKSEKFLIKYFRSCLHEKGQNRQIPGKKKKKFWLFSNLTQEHLAPDPKSGDPFFDFFQKFRVFFDKKWSLFWTFFRTPEFIDFMTIYDLFSGTRFFRHKCRFYRNPGNRCAQKKSIFPHFAHVLGQKGVFFINAFFSDFWGLFIENGRISQVLWGHFWPKREIGVFLMGGPKTRFIGGGQNLTDFRIRGRIWGTPI